MSSESPAACCYFDTSYIESRAFSFGDTAYTVLRARALAGSVRVLYTQLTISEVGHRAAERVGEFLAAYSKVDKERYILRFLMPDAHGLLEEVSPKLVDVDFNEIAARSASRFLADCRATELPWSSVDVEKMFAAYFGKMAPFGNGKKRKEFVDAAVMIAIDAFHADTGLPVHVVSADSDFTQCAESRSWLTIHSSLVDFLSTVQVSDDELVSEARAVLDGKWELVNKAILDSAVEAISIHPDDFEGDIQIEAVERVVPADLKFEVLGGEVVAVFFEANLSVDCFVELPDPEKTAYDEGRIILAYRKGNVEIDVPVTVQLEFGLLELRKGRVDPRSIVIEQLGSHVVYIDPYDLDEDESFYD